MAREDVLRSLFDASGFGLEVGPSYNPLLPKRAGYNVETLDHTDQLELIKKYPAGADVIEPVDYVSDGRSMSEVIGATERYDFIFASHVIEHTTDLVGFLRDCEALLRPAGVLVLAVPDRRYCFDFFRPSSSLGQIVQSHFERRTRHTFAARFDNVALRTTRGGEIAWQESQRGPWELSNSPASAFAQVGTDVDTAGYEDLHGWTFTPSLFRSHLKALHEMQMIGLAEARIERTAGFEFYVVLAKNARPPSISYKDLLLAAADEEREVPVRTAPPAQAAIQQIDWQSIAEAATARLAAIEQSRSWRLTASLRSVRRALLRE